jgi:predicted alpha-1,2-mannosidase
MPIMIDVVSSRNAHPARIIAPALVAALFAATLVATPQATDGAVAAQPRATGTAQESTNFVDYVDPFMSTEDDFGQDIPGAYVPNGLVKANPMTGPGRSHTGYDYAQPQIAGFTLSNLDGAGGSGGGGDFLVVPTNVSYTKRPATGSYAKTFSHDAEAAEPGYYQVDLQDTRGEDGTVENAEGQISAQMTTDVRTAVERFTFPETGKSSLVVDLKNNFTSRISSNLEVTILDDGRASIEGKVVGVFNAKYSLYYYAETSQPVSSVTTWGDDGTLSDAKKRSGVDTGAILTFDAIAGQPVELRASLSPVSADQAKLDQEREVAGLSFDEVRQAATDSWNALLGKVDVSASITSDPDGELIRLFYTSLYRMVGTPVNATSTSGTWRGVDGVIYKADGYTHYDSWYTWDDFRKFSVLAYIYPDLYGDMAQSLVDLFATTARAGASSVGSLTQSVPSCRWERSPIIIADAISKGYTLEGLDEAFPVLAKEADRYDDADDSRGYLDGDPGNTVGTAYDDYGLSVIADAIGETKLAADYRQKAGNFANTIKPGAWTAPDGTDVGVLTSRASDGSFATTDLERFETSGLYQGTLWQYNWYPASDMAGLVDAMGGTHATQLALSHLFGEEAPDDGSRMLHSNANEIDLQAPYLFNYVGQPSHTQYWVRNIYTKETWNRYIATGSTHEAPSGGGEFTPPIKTKVYSLDPQGFLPTMDNDAGTMSTMFVAAALGLFPVTAGSDQYQIGTPFFEQVDIAYPDGETFTVTADGVSPDDFYVQSAKLNGADLNNTWVTYDDVVGGGELDFTMGDTASEWGANTAPAYSLSLDDNADGTPASDPISLSSTRFIESGDNDGSIAKPIVVTVSGASIVGNDGDDLTAQGLVTATELPEGLTLTAVKTGTSTIELRVTGSAVAHLDSDDVDGISVHLKDALFSGGVTSANKTVELGIRYRGLTVSSSSTSIAAAEDGSIDGEIELTLRGGGRFAGAAGDDLVATGAARLVGLPDGVTGTMVRSDDTHATIHLVGTLSDISASRFSVKLLESAFSDDVDPSVVTGTGLTTREPFEIVVTALRRTELATDLADARLIVLANYTASSFAAVVSARDRAATVLADVDATDSELRNARSVLTTAVGGLELGEGGLRRLEGEASDSWSGGSDLHNEPSNLGGVRPDAWVGYEGVDFGDGNTPEEVQVRYASASVDGYDDAAVEVRAGAVDGPIVATVDLPYTGTNFDTFETASATISDVPTLTAATSVYFVFRGTTPAGEHWVANVDWFQFASGDATPSLEPLTPATATEIGPGLDVGDPTKFQNTNNGEYATWADYDFGTGTDTLSVYYDKPSSRTSASSHLDIYLDSMDGEPAHVVDLPTTGSGWGTYTTVTATLDDPSAFEGVHDVFVVFRAPEADGDHPYIGNIGAMTFSSVANNADEYVLEAESFAEKGGSATLGTEQSTWNDGSSVTNLKGTADGDWLRYAGVEFGSRTVTSVGVHYVNNSSRSGLNSRIDVFLDAREGEPVASIPLPVTGDAWSEAGTFSMLLPTAISGTHDVFLELHTTPDANHPYVANIDSLTFRYGVDKTALRSLVSSSTPLVNDANSYVPADFATFSAALDAAQVVLDDDLATASEVTSAARSLRLAVGQLESRSRRALEIDVDEALAVDRALYTDESVATLQSALAAAHVVLEIPDAPDSDLTAASSALTSAIAALDVRPASVPVAPQNVSAVVEGRAVTISWTAPDDGGEPITSWRVALEGAEPVTIDDPQTTSFTFRGLQRGRTYRATVIAVNAVGASAPSAYTAYVPVAAIAPTAPNRPTLSVAGAAITVAWSAPDDGGSVITGYRVRLDDGTAVDVPADAREHTFTNVGVGDHSARVAAVNAAGASGYSTESNSVTVRASVPAPAVRISNVTATRAKISWSASAPAGTVFAVTIRNSSGSVVRQSLAWSDESAVTITGLSAKRAYTAEIQVLGRAGGATSPRVAFSTPDKPKVKTHGVAIKGKAVVGSKLTAKAVPSKWTKGSKLSYLWTANGKKIAKKTSPSLTVKKAWVGKRITVTVTGTKSGYRSATRSSEPTKKVVASRTRR